MSSLTLPLRPSSTHGVAAAFRFPIIIHKLHLFLSLGLIVALDKLLELVFTAWGLKFPSSLVGLSCVFFVLMVVEWVDPRKAAGVVVFFEPASLFVQRWLPLFYVPGLVVLPLAVRGVAVGSLVKIVFIIVGGWLASLIVAGYAATTVRSIMKTEMMDAEQMGRPSEFTNLELWSWTAVIVPSLILAFINPTALGTSARTFLPFLLAATVLGYMVGSRLPEGVTRVFHPIVCCLLFAEIAAVTFAYFSQSGIDVVLGNYLTKVPSNPGAGDILMWFLGSVVIQFAFFMFKQRKLIKRHALEIFSSVIIAALFSLYSTAIIGRLVGLEPTLTISILPRCITVALAVSIASLFEDANASITVAVVVLTGIVGANFVQIVMDKLRLHDPITRGIATAASCHGLGTSGLSAKEPEALPFCAIAYSLTGIFATLFCSVPVVRQSFLLIAG